MKTKLLTLIFAITLTNSVWATTTFTTFKTFGAADCGEWIKGQLITPNHPNKAWLLGFLTGLNANEYYKNALSKVSSAEQIFLWTDNFCKTNPLEMVSTGAYILMKELKNKK